MKINLDVNSVSEKVDPLRFGHNLEHTRSCMWQGLCAQIIRNRKFAGRPSRYGLADEWYSIGARDTFFALNELTPYTQHVDKESRGRWAELQKQLISSGDSNACGIGQRDIPLLNGRNYEFRLIAESKQELTITATFYSNNHKQKIASHSWNIVPGHWQTCEYSFSIDKNIDGALLEITFDVNGIVGIGAVSLQPKEHFHNMRLDVIEKLKEIGVPLLRWPGGNFAGDYRWQDALLPVDQRGPLQALYPKETLPHSNGYDFHEVGIDEFMALCRELGAEPFISVNLFHEGPEGAAAWVEYCNGSPDTKWGAKRVKRGHVNPYNVKFWSLGNELGYEHMEGMFSPANYAKAAGEVYKAMFAKDSKLAVAMSGQYYEYNDWYTVCLKSMSDKIDYLSYHDYAHIVCDDTPYFQTGEFTVESFENLIRLEKDFEKKIRRTRTWMDKTTGQKKVSLSIDEWNVWYSWYRESGIFDAIFSACFYNFLVREGNQLNIGLGCYFEPVNEGAIIVEYGKSFLTATGQVFKLFKAHQGKSILMTETQLDDTINIAASYDTDKSVLFISSVNLSSENTQAIRLELRDGAFKGKAEITLLYGNGFNPRENYASKKWDMSAENNILKLSLPPFGISLICVSVENEFHGKNLWRGDSLYLSLDARNDTPPDRAKDDPEKVSV